METNPLPWGETPEGEVGFLAGGFVNVFIIFFIFGVLRGAVRALMAFCLFSS